MNMKRYDVRSAAFTRLGRFNPDEAGCALWWSGSGVRVRLDGRRAEIEATVADDDNTPWLCVTADGEPVARFPLRPGTHRYDLLGAMEAGVAHDIEILRDTQPTDSDTAPLLLEALYTDGAPAPAAHREKLIEFIGDSLTVGEGTVGPVDGMEWRMVWISNQFAFPTLTAGLMQADKRVIALGGWGAYLSYDANPEHTLGAIYEQLCGTAPAGRMPYDFAAQRKADAVVINLGTNDGSGLEKLGGDEAAGRAALEESAAKLLALVRAHNPDAAILWAYGLCGDAVAEPLKRAVARRVAGGDGNLAYLALDNAEEPGSRCHPGRRAHQRAAAQIAEALRQMMK